MPPGVFFTLMLDSVVIRLRDAYELAIVALCPHYSSVVQLVHSRQNAKAAEKTRNKTYLAVCVWKAQLKS